jgi:hypothetical protein
MSASPLRNPKEYASERNEQQDKHRPALYEVGDPELRSTFLGQSKPNTPPFYDEH